MAIALSGAASYAWLDRPLAMWVESFPTEAKRFFAQATKLGHGGVWLTLVAVIGIASLALSRRRSAARAGFVFAAILVAGIAVNLLKLAFARYRPSMLLKHRLWGFQWFHGDYEMYNMASFPSGHTTTMLALATALTFLRPRLWTLWYGVAIVIASTRVFSGSHYLSDVLAGGYLGAVMACAVRALCERVEWWNFVAPTTTDPATDEVQSLEPQLPRPSSSTRTHWPEE